MRSLSCAALFELPVSPGIPRGGSVRADIPPTEGFLMSAGDKISNKLDDMAGKAKEGVGKATDDKSTENEGKLDQAKASLKDAGEKVKDAVRGD
jgi:uncharacterized protein YjbJ (UPF0337 family)